MEWIIIVCYILAMHGITTMVTESYGPFDIFVHIRNFANYLGESIGKLFHCPLCFGTNIGWIFSVINWFFIPFAISPFNIILKGTDLWWLALILDGAMTGACTYFLYLIDNWIDSNTPEYEDE